MADSAHSVEVKPTGKSVGALILGVDLTQQIGPAVQAKLKEAWHEHLVLLFRGQSLEPGQYMAAARIFGTPQAGAMRGYYQRAGKQSVANSLPFPEMTLLSNLDERGQPVERNSGLGSMEVVWHSDNSYIERPPAGSILYSIELPDDGSGATSFNNQYLAFEELPDDLAAAIHGRSSKHDASRNSAGVLRPGVEAPACAADVPGPMHPLVRVHPETGRKALYLGRRRVWPSQYIAGYSDADSEALLDRLWAHATQDKYKWTHHWEVGDLLVWDNRCAMHYRDPVNSTQRRVMWRSQFRGETVVAA